eukprot:gnl/TRDRNA2_/TRDRNA2_150795_c1_seq1.p1 gnl/TRDRNA2_/TRDRNA2_150795_c1~~gnl/TRDRNA2_/TRDRNA2_150795_c1_seq1.p1  ORF type:complete len:332 (+),score=85.00 gnl/TRDRNA2_/TRDRNA2_150795_c1_seq1:46-996(+)
MADVADTAVYLPEDFDWLCAECDELLSAFLVAVSEAQPDDVYGFMHRWLLDREVSRLRRLVADSSARRAQLAKSLASTHLGDTSPEPGEDAEEQSLGRPVSSKDLSAEQCEVLLSGIPLLRAATTEERSKLFGALRSEELRAGQRAGAGSWREAAEVAAEGEGKKSADAAAAGGKGKEPVDAAAGGEGKEPADTAAGGDGTEAADAANRGDGPEAALPQQENQRRRRFRRRCATRLYMLVRGELVEENPSEERQLVSGQYFGELALLGVPRNVPLKVASETAEVYSLGPLDVRRLMGPLEEVLERRAKEAAERCNT